MKQPKRPHHLKEWAETRGWAQADLARAVGAAPGVVSRWYSGATPGVQWQALLGALFGVDPEALFRHPDEAWMVAFLNRLTREDVARAKAMLQAAFSAPAHNQPASMAPAPNFEAQWREACQEAGLTDTMGEKFLEVALRVATSRMRRQSLVKGSDLTGVSAAPLAQVRPKSHQ